MVTAGNTLQLLALKRAPYRFAKQVPFGPGLQDCLSIINYLGLGSGDRDRKGK